MRRAFRVCAGVAWLAAATAIAGPADLDPAFGDAGVARIPEVEQMVGGALARDGTLVIHGQASGVMRLDALGRLDAAFTLIPPQPDFSTQGFLKSFALLPDGSIAALYDNLLALSPLACQVALGSHDAGGRFRSVVYGGSSLYTCGSGGLVVDERGTVYFPRITGAYGPSFGQYRGSDSQVVRMEMSGRWDNLGQVFGDPPPWRHGKVAIQRDGRILVLLHGVPDGLTVLRLDGNVPDASFGVNGIAAVTRVEASGASDVVAMPDGRIVLAGLGRIDGLSQPVVVRLTAEGVPDLTFGDAGIVNVRLAGPGESAGASHAVVQPDGRVVVAAWIRSSLGEGRTFDRVAIVRLEADGRPDVRFAPGGIAEFWWEGGTQAVFLALRPDGRIVAGVNIFGAAGGATPQGALMQLQGGDDAVARPLKERQAVEYFHAGFGHYFVTANPHEVAVLDTSPAMGFARTGRTFGVWDVDAPSLAPVCRFWSDQSFAPKSSHFYSPYPHECALLESGSVWRYERTAFHVRLPEGLPGARHCPAGSQALYRAYNNGLSGAPNHRYVTDAELLDQMIAQGWTMEGEAGTRVFACVPVH